MRPRCRVGARVAGARGAAHLASILEGGPSAPVTTPMTLVMKLSPKISHEKKGQESCLNSLSSTSGHEGSTPKFPAHQPYWSSQSEDPEPTRELKPVAQQRPGRHEIGVRCGFFTCK